MAFYYDTQKCLPQCHSNRQLAKIVYEESANLMAEIDAKITPFSLETQHIELLHLPGRLIEIRVRIEESRSMGDQSLRYSLNVQKIV